MKAVSSDISYVKSCCPPNVYRSVWDRLVKEIFGPMPIGMNGELQIPNIDVWEDDVVKLNNTEPYSFTVWTDDDDAPKPGDAILYKGVYYIIGEVDQS